MIRARHDPYSFIDRFPRGACPAGSVVCLRITTPDAPQNVWVRLWRGGGEEWVSMRPVSSEVYEVHVPVGNETGLVWYYFVLENAAGERTYVGKPENRAFSLYEHEPPSFQITVYRERKLPDWYRNAVFYQIFPDRFVRDAQWESSVLPHLGDHPNGPEPLLLHHHRHDPQRPEDLA